MKKTITFKATDELWEKLEKIAKEMDRSVSWVMRKILISEVNKEGK